MISVIIPARNVGKVVEQCLTSLRQQSYHDFECIVIDDASTDETGEVLRRLAVQDRRIQILTNSSNMGPSFCRNLGLSIGAGQYVAFVDADDWLEVDALKLLHNFADEHGLDYCFSTHKEFLEQRSEMRSKTLGLGSGSRVLAQADLFNYVDQYVASPSAYCGLVHCWARLFRRDLIAANGLSFDVRLSQMEDVAFNFAYLQHCSRVGYVDLPLYTHRIPVTGNLGSAKGLEPDFDVKLLQAIAPLRAFLLKCMLWDDSRVRQRLDHFYASMIIVSIVRQSRSFFSRPTADLYGKIRRLIAAANTQSAIARYTPGRRESRYLGIAIRRQWTALALAICLLKRTTRLPL